MEINKVDEAKQGLMSSEIEKPRYAGRPCIYYPEQQCSVPNLKFKICQQCPRACQYVRKNVVQSVFDHVRNLAISLLNHMGVSTPVGGSGGGRGGSGSGAGAGGGTGGGGGGA